jgi:hypothetical protein
MSEIVIDHFLNVDEPDLHFDGERYSVKGETSKDEYPNIYEGLTEEEMKRGHHINYYTFRKFFELLRKFENPNILETGSSGWSPTSSSLLFDRFVNKYGGRFFTVDLVPYTIHRLKPMVSHLTEVHLGDSIEYIKNFKHKIDAVYLDSFCIEWLNYEPSAQHGKKEMEALLPHLNNKSIILIDDTPVSPFFLPYRGDVHSTVSDLFEITGNMPGKGMYAEEVLKANSDKFRYTKVLHMYAVIFEVERIPN